jgi:hypothetical protein
VKDNAFAQQTMREIVGQKLSAVVFGVFADLSLEFNGPSLVAHNPVSLTLGDRILRFGDPGFCDVLCSQLGQIVSDVRISNDELRIAFGDQSSFAMSLREADYAGPEAGTYYSADKRVMVFTL